MYSSRSVARKAIMDLCLPLLSRKQRPAGSKLFYDLSDIHPHIDAATIRTEWDFSDCLGDTIKEKYEALCEEVADLTVCIRASVLKHDGPNFDGNCWMVTSPEIGSIFETATAGFEPSASRIECNGLILVGEVEGRWRLFNHAGCRDYGCRDMDNDIIVVGCGMPPTQLTTHHIGVVTARHYI